MDAKFLPRLFFLFAAIAAMNQALAARAQAASAITFGITSATAFSIPHYIANEKKYYEAEGLSVDTIIAGSASNAPFRMVAAKGTKRWGELKGKSLSVGGLTDVTLYFLRVMARRNGLADQDYDLLYGGGTPNRFAQLVSGAVAAAILTNPHDFAALGELAEPPPLAGFIDASFLGEAARP